MAHPRGKRSPDAIPARSVDIWAQLEAALGPQMEDTRPPNSVTISEFAIRRGCGVSSAGRALNGLVAQGKMQRVRFRGQDGHPEYAYTMTEG